MALRQAVAAVPLLLPIVLDAQQVKRMPLSAPQALTFEFTRLINVRELANGSLLVADGGDNVLYHATFGGAVQPVSRRGHGPLEYERVLQLKQLAGDSTLLVDLFNGRFLFFVGAAPVATVIPQPPRLVSLDWVAAGADTLRHFLYERVAERPRVTQYDVRPTDSGSVVMFDRRSTTFDTVARLRPSPVRIRQTFNDSGRRVGGFTESLESDARGEDAFLMPDGWLALVRLEPFRIDWRRPDGSWVKGSALPVASEVTDAADKRAYETRMSQARADAKKIGFPAPVAIPPTVGAPRHPWSGDTPAAAPDGRLLVPRTSRAAVPFARWLVVNRAGGLDGEIALPRGAQVVGAGRRQLYVKVKDDDDVERLYRYPWP
jgi:hypothetical protein